MNTKTFTNTTSIKVPAKYAKGLELVEQDVDGYWAYTVPGFQFTATDCHTASADTQAGLLFEIRTMVPCDCEDCKKSLGQVESVNEEPQEEPQQEEVKEEKQKEEETAQIEVGQVIDGKKILEIKKLPHPGDHCLRLVFTEYRDQFVSFLLNLDGMNFAYGRYADNYPDGKVEYRKHCIGYGIPIS